MYYSLINSMNRLAPSNPLWNNLISYWTGDNTPNDAIGTANGTLVNGATYTTGKINNGFSLDGVNDYVDLGNTFNFDGTTAFSTSFWFKLNGNIANYTLNYLFGNQTTTAFPANGWGFFIYTGDGGASNKLQFALASSNTRCWVDIKNNLVSNIWYHCVMTYNGNGLVSGLNTYIDTVSLKTTRADSLTTPINASSQKMTIGSSVGTGNFFKGTIDEVAIWNKVLTPTEVTELYNSGSGKQYPL